MIVNKVKLCTRCGQTKPLKLFKKARKYKNGRSSWCKACHSLSVCEYQKKNRILANTNNRRYKQTAKGRNSIRRYKKGKVGKLATKRSNSNPVGKARCARMHAVRASRKRNVIGINDLTHNQWEEILISQNYKCKICGIRFEDSNIKRRAERDHIVPIKNGGALTKSNVQALCRSCNARKGDNNDTDLKDQTFIDLCHFELLDKRW